MEDIEKNIKMRNQELEMMIQNIPGAVMQCLDDPCYTLVSMSSGFFQMCGYSREEISEKFDNKLGNMIHPLDRGTLEKSKNEQLKKQSVVELEYRILCKDESLLWVLSRGRLGVREDEPRAFFCILLDITQRKKQQEELRLSLERHKVIMDQASDILFEWDIATDTIAFSSNWEKKFGYLPMKTHISRRIPQTDRIHPEDVAQFLKIEEDSLQGVPYSETELRIRDCKNNDIWCRIRATTQIDQDNHPVKTIGVIIDIDAEKKQKIHLENQAQCDLLTQLYNKGTTETKIEAFLTEEGKSGSHALMILDVDNFKTINDQFGHLCGDAVLSSLAKGLKKRFRVTDLIGRIGGDEFLIFLPNVPNRKAAENKAKDAVRALEELPPEINAGISCSVGIALFPCNAQTYTGLCQCADNALYQVKNTGKNNYACFEETMQDGVPYTIPRTAINEQIDSEKNQDLDQKLVQLIFRMIYNAVDTETAVNQILKIVGLAYGVSRVYIFENSEDGQHCNNTFEWCGEGILPQIAHLQNISYEKDLGGYFYNFDQNGVLYCPDITTLHPDLYGILAPQGIVSILQCAIRDDGIFQGYVGFDECKKSRFWTKQQIDSLTLIANLLSTFLLKQRVKEQLCKLKQENE